jgi:cob(I)alamin adenosyltransferase
MMGTFAATRDTSVTRDRPVFAEASLPTPGCDTDRSYGARADRGRSTCTKPAVFAEIAVWLAVWALSLEHWALKLFVPSIISRVKIYTKTGDAGDTSLFDKTRVSKADPRVDAYGEVDELNACIGAARAAGVGDDLAEELATIQKQLFAVGARLADPASRIAARVTKAAVTDTDVERQETLIDRLEAELPPLRRFILPGGSSAGSLLHLARTICRRAERRVVGLGADAVEPIVIVYLNRLSDLLFVMARAINHRAKVPETEW